MVIHDTIQSQITWTRTSTWILWEAGTIAVNEYVDKLILGQSTFSLQL